MKKFFYTLILLSFIIGFVVGCAGSPARLSTMDREELSEVSEEELIRAIASKYFRNELLIEEVKERGLFTSQELSLIKERKIGRGMSEKALKASWGKPSDINKSVGSYGVHKQYVYGGSSNRSYVYVKNGKVSGWQN